jgi:hypothetical protein
MKPLPQSQMERPVERVATKVISLPGATAGCNPARFANHHVVNPVIRCAFHVFIFSLLFELPDRRIPMGIQTLIGFIYLAFTLLQPTICYRSFPRGLWFYVAYLCCYASLLGIAEHKDDAIKHLELMVQIFFLMWSGYNLLRYERIAKTALLTLVASCSVISIMQLPRIGATGRYDFYAGSLGALLAFGICLVIFAVRRKIPAAGVKSMFVALAVLAGVVVANYEGAGDTHNMFLDVLASTGLLGAVSLCAFIVNCMLAAWRARHGSQGVLPLALVVMVILMYMNGNWIASKFDWLIMVYAMASASPLLALKPRLVVAWPTSPTEFPLVTYRIDAYPQ